MSTNFTVKDTLLGTRLVNIKNNYIDILSPTHVTTNSTLTVDQLSNALLNGLVGDVTNSSISIQFPTSSIINSLLYFNKYDYFNIPITAYSDIFPSVYNLQILPNTGVSIASGSLNININPQTTKYIYLQCINSQKEFILY